MDGRFEKGWQRTCVAPDTSDEPVDRFVSDAPVVVPQATQEVVWRLEGLRYAPRGGPRRSILGYPRIVVLDDRDPLSRADVDGVRAVLRRQVHKGKGRTIKRRRRRSLQPS